MSVVVSPTFADLCNAYGLAGDNLTDALQELKTAPSDLNLIARVQSCREAVTIARDNRAREARRLYGILSHSRTQEVWANHRARREARK